MFCLSFFKGRRETGEPEVNNPNPMPEDPPKQQPQPQKTDMGSKHQSQVKNSLPSYLANQPSPSNSYSPPSAPPGKELSGIPDPNPPPYHNWQEVPGTSTFPPPPVATYFNSNAGNASSDDAERAHVFCDTTPLWQPVKPPAAVYRSVQEHDLRPVISTEFHGRLSPVCRGRWNGSTKDRNGDCIIITNLPLYFPVEDSPFVTGRATKTIYFEVKLLGLGTGPGRGAANSSGFSIGYGAQPYPSWRSPGWERGSLGVFSDDGCRFVNDSWGGREFASEFQVGETVGLGMTFSRPDKGMKSDMQSKLAVDISFTRNGQWTGGWELYEEVDAEAGSVEGLEGDHDLYAAVGLFGGVDFDVCFDPAGWLWKV